MSPAPAAAHGAIPALAVARWLITWVATSAWAAASRAAAQAGADVAPEVRALITRAPLVVRDPALRAAVADLVRQGMPLLEARFEQAEAAQALEYLDGTTVQRLQAHLDASIGQEPCTVKQVAFAQDCLARRGLADVQVRPEHGKRVVSQVIDWSRAGEWSPRPGAIIGSWHTSRGRTRRALPWHG